MKKQRNIIWDIIPPKINVSNDTAIARRWENSRCVAALLIGLLVFIPAFPVFAEEIGLPEEAVSVEEETLFTEENEVEEITEEILMPNTDVSSSSPEIITEDEIESASILSPILPEEQNQDDLGEVGKEISGTSTTEIIEEDVITTSTEEILMPATDVSSSSPEIVEEENDASTTVQDILDESAPEEAPVLPPTLPEEQNRESSISQPNQDDLGEIGKEITGTSTIITEVIATSSSPEVIEEDVLEDSEARYSTVPDEARHSTVPGEEVENTDAIIEFKSETATSSTATSSAEQNLFAGKECIFLNNRDDFYCFKSNKEFNASTSIENLGTIEKGKVFSIRDSDGDREIFFSINSTSTQVTNNNWDDLFPALNTSGSSIVWQSLINERWQIMFYDQGTATTTQITDSDFNNMMPQIYGDIIVWQGWPKDNWEIFYAKKNNDGEWIVKQVTNNDYPDMFPKVMGSSIAWQAFGGGGWHIFAYDIKSDAITKISATGIKNENPRFMIVWEEKGNGTTTRIFGYNLSSGEIVELNNKATQEIPEPPLKNDAAISASTSTPNKLEDEESD